MATGNATTDHAVSFAELLRDPNIRRLWLASNIADLGAEIARVALPLLVFAMTDSASLLGVVYVITMLPRIVLAPFAGVIADRIDRRRIMLSADTARMVLVCLLPFADQIWQITAIATVSAAFSAIATPAQMAAVPMVAGEKRLLQTISLSQISGAAVGVIGPSLGAVLVGLLGAGPSFFAQGVCFAISLVIVFRLRLPPSAAPATGPSSLSAWWQELTLGFRITWRQRVLRGIVGAEMIWGGAGVILIVGLVAYTERTLHLGDRAGITFAILTAAFSAGTVVGGVLASRVQQRFGRSFMLGFGYCAPALLALVWLTPPLPVVFALLFLFGLSDSWLVVAFEQVIVERVPDAQRGRFYATFSALNALTWAGWNGGLGSLIDRIGAPLAFLFVGIACGVGCPLIIVLSGAIRDLLSHDRGATSSADPGQD